MKQQGFKIAAKAADKGIMLKWGEVSGADGYRVYMKEDGGEFKGIRNVTETTVKLTGLENGRVYTLMVKASNNNEYVSESEEVSCPALGVPAGLIAIAGDEQVTLSWTPVEFHNDEGFYRIYISDDNSEASGDKAKFTALMYTGKETCTVRGLKNKTNYKFKVRAGTFAQGLEYFGGFSSIAGGMPMQDDMRITPPYLYMETGQTNDLTCAAQNVQWISSDNNIAEVSPTGSVTAKKNGSVIITADSGGKQTQADIFVGRDKSQIRPAMAVPRFMGRNNFLFPNKVAARIIIAGDMMCPGEQQDYEECFDGVREIIKSADYAAGTIIYEYSRKRPFAIRQPWLEGKRNFNAPPLFTEAIRNAGFDCAASVLAVSPETASEYIRCGINYADFNQKGSRVIADINGIKIAFITFKFDGATASITPNDIAAVKKEGAEYIIAVCRWGVPGSHMTRDNQFAAAEKIASLGADFIVGGGPGVIQGNEIITTQDRREVHVYYSLGSFITGYSELGAARSSELLSLTIEKPLDKRNSDLTARLTDIKVIPCICDDAYRIMPASAQTEPAENSIVVAPSESPAPQPKKKDIKLSLIGSGMIQNLLPVGELIGASALNITEIPKADYLVIDFYDSAIMPLNGVKPSFKDSFWKAGMDNFIETAKSAYKGENIILIKHRLNKFYASKKQIRLLGEAPGGDGEKTQKLARIIKRLEDYFIEQVNPTVIASAGEYFAAGQNTPFYDEFFIQHARRELDGIFNGEKPNFGDIWLKRYLYYYDNLTLRKLAPFVLDKNCPADTVAEKSSKSFIREYSDSLIQIKNAGLSFQDVFDSPENYPAEFIAGLKAIKAISDGELSSPDINYSVMFDYDFEVLGSLINPVQAGLKEHFPEFDAAITVKTLPFYFKLLKYVNGIKKNKANKETLSYIKDALNEYALASSPMKIDVWGTDLSYISAAACPNVAVMNYIEKNSFCWAFTDPIEHTEEMFESAANFMGSEELRNDITTAFKRQAGNIVSESKSEWLIADFFDLASEMAAYKGGFFEIDEFIRRTMFFNNIVRDCKFFRLYKNYDKKKVFAALDKMIEAVKAKYGNNIILNRISPAEYFINLEGDVVELNVDKEFVEKTGAIIAECEEYFIEKTGCFVIDITGYFMSDERYPHGGADIGNFEELFYKNTALFMKNIFTGKNDTKVYDKINSVYRLMKVMEHE
ncbi:MAG: CapA family protein [Oscillospiraceae bacterium]|nr:CapA family protein [Oscillospiraceae bacterium]